MYMWIQARDLDTVSSITYSIADENVTDLVNIDSSNGEIKIINSHGLERMNSSDSIAFDVMVCLFHWFYINSVYICNDIKN